MLDNWNNNNPLVINLHLTNRCNMNCLFCFGKFKQSDSELSYNNWLKIIELIYNDVKHIPNRRLNFAGGEPLLLHYVSDLLDYAKKLGFKTSIITNGSLLSENFLNKNANVLDVVGISIDSLDYHTNVKSGRRLGKAPLSEEDYIKLCQLVKTYNIKLKVNTVVHKFNYNKSLAKLLDNVTVDRYKILRMVNISNENNGSEFLLPSDEEFNTFVNEHKRFNPVIEDSGDMIASYIFISPNGDLMDNSCNQFKYDNNILEKGFKDAFHSIHLEIGTYCKKYK